MAAFPFRSNSGAHGGSVLCFWQSEKLSGAHENSLQPMPGSVCLWVGGLLVAGLLFARFLVDLWMTMACRKPHARLLYSRLGKRSSRCLTFVARACIARHSHSRWTWKLAQVPKRDDDLAAKPCPSESDEHPNPSAVRQVDCSSRGELTAPSGSVCLWVGGCWRVGWGCATFLFVLITTTAPGQTLRGFCIVGLARGQRGISHSWQELVLRDISISS